MNENTVGVAPLASVGDDMFMPSMGNIAGMKRDDLGPTLNVEHHPCLFWSELIGRLGDARRA